MNVWRAALGVLLLFVAGCGGQPELKQFEREIAPEVAQAESMRSLVTSLHGQLKSEGMVGLKSALIVLDERLEPFQGSAVGEKHRAAYETILKKLKELAAGVESGQMNQSAADELLQEVQTLADALPK